MASVIYTCICPSCGDIKGVSGDENGNLTSNKPFCPRCGVPFISTKVPILEYARMEKEKRDIWETEMREKYAPGYKQRLEQEQTTALEEASSLQEHPVRNALKKFLLLFLYFFFRGLANLDTEDDEDSFITFDTSNHHSHSHSHRTGGNVNISNSTKFSSGGGAHKHSNRGSGGFSSGGGSRGGGAGRR